MVSLTPRHWRSAPTRADPDRAPPALPASAISGRRDQPRRAGRQHLRGRLPRTCPPAPTRPRRRSQSARPAPATPRTAAVSMSGEGAQQRCFARRTTSRTRPWKIRPTASRTGWPCTSRNNENSTRVPGEREHRRDRRVTAQAKARASRGIGTHHGLLQEGKAIIRSDRSHPPRDNSCSPACSRSARGWFRRQSRCPLCYLFIGPLKITNSPAIMLALIVSVAFFASGVTFAPYGDILTKTFLETAAQHVGLRLASLRIGDEFLIRASPSPIPRR